MQYVRSGKNWKTPDVFPDGVNTQIIKITDKNNIDTEGYERGAGYTLASGKQLLCGGRCGISDGTDRSMCVCAHGRRHNEGTN